MQSRTHTYMLTLRYMLIHSGNTKTTGNNTGPWEAGSKAPENPTDSGLGPSGPQMLGALTTDSGRIVAALGIRSHHRPLVNERRPARLRGRHSNMPPTGLGRQGEKGVYCRPTSILLSHTHTHTYRQAHTHTGPELSPAPKWPENPEGMREQQGQAEGQQDSSWPPPSIPQCPPGPTRLTVDAAHQLLQHLHLGLNPGLREGVVVLEKTASGVGQRAHRLEVRGEGKGGRAQPTNG